jgi:type I restriction enzyme S subunit
VTEKFSLPANWELHRLGDLIEIEMGQAPPGSDCNKVGVGTTFVKAGEFGSARPAIREWTTKPLRFAKYGDVLMCVVGATCGKLNLGIDCAIGRSVAALRPGPGLDQKYLYYFLLSKVLDFRQGSVGSAQGVISKEDIASLALRTAPLAEQLRLVAKIEELFSELDKGVESLTTAREQLKVYRQSVLKHAFEGKLTADWRARNSHLLITPAKCIEVLSAELDDKYTDSLASWECSVETWCAGGSRGMRPPRPRKLSVTPGPTKPELVSLPPLPEHWQWVRLGQLVWSVKDGPHYSPRYVSEGVPFISGGNIRPTGIDFGSAKFITPDLHSILSAH